MRRREFIILVGGAAAVWPVAARAQQTGRMFRISFVAGSNENDPEIQASKTAFREGLRKLGWVDGFNIRIEYRFGVTTEEHALATAAEIVRSAPDAILAIGLQNAQALQRETRTIPIVFMSASDPVERGSVESLARPGGNLRPFTSYWFPIGGKWLEMLKQAAPSIRRTLVIRDRLNPGSPELLRALQTVAAAYSVDAIAADTADAAEIERAVNDFAQVPGGGLITWPGAHAQNNRDLIIGLAARHRLPALYTSRTFIAGGGLMSYDANQADLFRRAASEVDRILRGLKPLVLPVQSPVKYDLVINLKVAKSLGLTVPLPLLALADEVID